MIKAHIIKQLWHFFVLPLYKSLSSFTFMRRFYPKRLTVHSGYTCFVSTCVPWESNPQPLHCWRNALPLNHRNTICFLCLLVLHGTRTRALRFTKANGTGCATEQVYFVGKVIHMELIMWFKLVHYMVKAFLKWKHSIMQGNMQLLTLICLVITTDVKRNKTCWCFTASSVHYSWKLLQNISI